MAYGLKAAPPDMTAPGVAAGLGECCSVDVRMSAGFAAAVAVDTAAGIAGTVGRTELDGATRRGLRPA